jgi:hypothetical protein
MNQVNTLNVSPSEQDLSWQAMQQENLKRHWPRTQVTQIHPDAIESQEHTFQSTVVPQAIMQCWFLLKESRLGEGMFSRLIILASGREAQSRSGLDSLRSQSLASFLHFWSALRQLAGPAEPDLSISPKGNIQAQWVKSGESFLVMEFQKNGDIFFSLWQEDYPLEGIQPGTRMSELIHVFNAMQDNPLGWTDAA